jgi:hypothetical protein
MAQQTSVYVVLTFHPGWISAYLHRKTGQGRAARRQLLTTVHVPERPQGDVADTLEAVARELRLPPMQRWQPPLPGLGGPRGGGGGSKGSTLT